MKNILNVNKISLKPIFMSLAILFTAGISFPYSFEKVVSASYSDEQTIDENTEDQNWNGIPEGRYAVTLLNHDKCTVKRIDVLEWPFGFDTDKFDVPELPEKSHGYPRQGIYVREDLNGSIDVAADYGSTPRDYDELSSMIMEVRSVKFKNSNASVNNDLDDIGRLDGNSREQSLWQKCCSCCFKNSNKKND